MTEYQLSYREQIYAQVNNLLPVIVFEMTEELDEEMLAEAVTDALDRHPVFRMKKIKKNGLYSMTENDKEPIIKRATSGERIVYGGPENNDYPWTIVCYENKLYFTGEHFMTDGAGVYNFLQSVFTFYFNKKQGLSIPPIPSEEKLNEITVNPFERYYKENTSRPFPHKKETDIAPISKEKIEENPEKRCRYIVSFDRNDVSERYRQTETSMFAYLGTLYAKAMVEWLEETEGNIVLRVPVNLRGIYNCDTDRCFVMLPRLTCPIKELKKDSVFLPATALRSKLDAFVDRDNLDSEVAKYIRNQKLIYEDPVGNRGLLPKPACSDDEKADCLYSHITRLGFPPELMKKIKFFYATFSNDESRVAGSNYDTRVYLVYLDRSKDGRFTKEFKKVIQKENLTCQFDKITLPVVFEQSLEAISPHCT